MNNEDFILLFFLIVLLIRASLSWLSSSHIPQKKSIQDNISITLAVAVFSFNMFVYMNTDEK